VRGQITENCVVQETGCEGVEWIHLAQDRGQFWM
jgi:hypothetical protein